MKPRMKQACLHLGAFSWAPFLYYKFSFGGFVFVCLVGLLHNPLRSEAVFSLPSFS